MKKTAIYSFMLLLSMLMGVQTSWAQTTPSKWDGTEATSFAKGNGTESSPYIISDASQLAYFGSTMNNQTWYVELGADIDLNNIEWTYGKNSASNFKGHFNGKKHTIKNLKIVPVSSKHNGFFCSLQGTTDSRAEVKNLVFDGVTISQTGNLDNNTYTGTLAGSLTEYTDIDSVTVKNVSISFANLTKTNYIGGFVGLVEKNNSEITHCTAENISINITGEAKGGASYIGGAIGNFAGSDKLLSSIVDLTVKSPSVTINKITIKDCYVGAVFGRVNTYSKLDSITVSSPTLTYNYTDNPNVALNVGSFAGGIFGVENQQTAVTNVKVDETALLTIGTEVNKATTSISNVKAGLIGQSATNVFLDNWTIANTKVDIKGRLTNTTSNIGGFAGYTINQDADNAKFITNKVKITGKSSISVSGDIEVATYLGGFVGYLQGRSKAGSSNTVSHDTIATAEISVGGKISKESRIGGFIGCANNGICEISNCKISTAANLTLNDIAVASYIGGFIGDFAGTNGFPASVKTSALNSPAITVTLYSNGTSQTGGVFGRVSTYTAVDGFSLTGASFKFTKDLAIAQQIGTFAANVTGDANQQISIKNVTIDDSKLTFGSSTSSNTVGLKAGIIGNVSTNVSLDTWTVNGNSHITVNGNLSTSTSHIGGFIGYATGASYGPLSIKNITFEKNDTISVTGSTKDATSYLGGFAGYFTTGDATDTDDIIEDVNIKGATVLSIAGVIGNEIPKNGGGYDKKGNVNVGGFAGYVQGKSQDRNAMKINHAAFGDIVINISDEIITGSYIGGLIGYATTSCQLNTVSAKTSTLTFDKAVKNKSYVGGAFGRFAGAANYPSSATSISIPETAITFKDTTLDIYAGGLVGELSTNCKLNSWTIKTPTITFSKDVMGTTYAGGAFGRLVGAADCPVTVTPSISLTEPSITFKGTTTTVYAGGIAGEVTTFCQLKDWTVKKPVLTFEDQIKAASYVGSAIGNFSGGAATTMSTLEKITVNNPTLTLKEITVKDGCYGNVFGRINNYSTVDGVTLTEAKLDYQADNLSVSIMTGTIAGYIVGNAAAQTSVSNVTLDKSALSFGKGTTSKIYGLYAGVVGQISTNILLDTWTITGNSSIKINGNLASTSRLGGLVGYMKSNTKASATLKNIKIQGNSSVEVVGSINGGSYLAGIAGQIEVVNNTTYAPINIENVDIAGTVTLTVRKEITASSYFGALAGQIQGRGFVGDLISINKVSFKESVITINDQITKESNLGGLVGYAITGCDFSECKITDKTAITLAKDLTATCYVGGAFGQLLGAARYPSSASSISINKPTISFKGTTTTVYAGGIAGQFSTNCQLKDLTVDTPVLTFEDQIKAASYVGSAIGNLTGGAVTTMSTLNNLTVKTPTLTIKEITVKDGCYGNVFGRINNYSAVENVNVGKSQLTYNGNTSVNTYFGGLAGYVTGNAAKETIIKNVKSTKASIAINGNVTANNLYLGGLIGYQNIATLTESSVSGADIVFNGNNASNTYIGGAVGWMNHTVAPYSLVQQVEVKDTKIHSSGTHTYAKGNKALVVGGVVAYMGQDPNNSKFTEVNNCVADGVDINFSSMGPEAANTSGVLYNQQQNAFTIGGVIGRINTPSRLPEALFYSGKIYAPFASVAPVVGIFLSKMDAAAYVYEDYAGLNAKNVSSTEWEKADTWHYSNYRIGLSDALVKEKVRTKNYASTSVVTEDDGTYVNVKDGTFSASNEINKTDKLSYTVLAYTNTGKDEDKSIYPSWNTNSATYPAYYMYFMQGVNRGKYVDVKNTENLKKNILKGLGTLVDLFFEDKNGDYTDPSNRGFVVHHMNVKTSVEVDGYKWYVDGAEQSVTTDAFTYEPSINGNTITVEAYKDGVLRKKLDYALKPVLRVKEVKTATTYGTQDHPYLIGNAKELQLLSYLSSLKKTIQWEKDYASTDHYNKAYYELDADIDISSIEDFTPISYPSQDALTENYESYLKSIVFEGVLDGQFHTIKGLHQTWHSGSFDINDMNVGWGLFSYVGNAFSSKKVGETTNSPAKICNLIFEGAVLKHKTNNTTFAYNGTEVANNCMVGILAGVVASNTVVENIEIRNSQITDEGSLEYSLATKGLYVGGAIGSVQNAFNSISDSPVGTKIDHVAAQVNVSLNNPAFVDDGDSKQLGQFNVGGIIGRYCAVNAKLDEIKLIMPAYTFYSGNITAQKAWISPVLAALRYQENQAVDNFTNYSKQWEGNNLSATQLNIVNAHYYNYSIEGKKVTEFYPDNSCESKARSVSFHLDGNGTAETYNAKMYQGVNYASHYVDIEGGSLKFLNENIVDGVYWHWADGFVHMSHEPYIGAYLILNENDDDTGLMATALMSDGNTGVSYRWQESFDGDNWNDVDKETEKDYAFVYLNVPKVIVAYITIGDKEYRTQPLLVSAENVRFRPYLKVSGNDADGYLYNVEWHGKAPGSSFAITYQWYKADKQTQMAGQTTSKLYLTKDDANDVGDMVWCKINLSYMKKDVDKYIISSPVNAHVVYIDGLYGIDNAAGSRERGFTPETPVKTIDHANSLLKTPAEGGNWNNNIIVVMGTMNTDGDFRSTGKNPATLTGIWDGIDYHGVIKIKQIDLSGGENSLNTVNAPGQKGANCYVLADTKFEHLTFLANNNAAGNNFIECHGNDVWFGTGLVMKGFKNLSDMHGNLNNLQTIPELTIVLTATNLGEDDIKKYTNRTKPQTLTIESGHYGRIMGGRYTNGFFNKAANTSHTILGSPEHPVWAVVNIDIDNDNSATDGESVKYTCDINCIIAGLTDGTMYGDYEINMHGGKVGYIVGGNQGNPVSNGNAKYKNVGVTNDTYLKEWGQWPNASYFGRTVINVEQNPDIRPIFVDNVYAGGLGRMANGDNAKSVVDMYTYGHTEINIKSGTINGNVYGGGAGGVIGKNPWDMHVPYATTDADNETQAILNHVQYGEWGPKKAGSPLISVTLHDADGEGGYKAVPLNLADSYTTLNISGGKINGNVYGGGCGYVANMPKEVSVQGVGSVFGNTNLTITGGTIEGSVYGGSEGSKMYYGAVNKYGQTITHIAEMNGIVNLSISGTEAQYPTIGGNIYGGGQGVASVGTQEYMRVATTGNTDLDKKYTTTVNITIDLPESLPFTGNIYGGGQLGLVDGSTNVLIKRGTFLGNIFGGGRGEDGHPDKAKVTGSTNVKIGD